MIGIGINNHPKNKRSNSNLYGDNGDLVKNMYGIWSLLYALYLDNLCMKFIGQYLNFICELYVFLCANQCYLNCVFDCIHTT